MTSASPPFVAFVDVEKRYDAARPAVAGLNLEVEKGEFLTLLGPSGSGKTTTLMMLAGFEAATAGDILMEGRPLQGVPPYRRNMGVVFQNYALFPHMSVADNVRFPLQVRGIKGEAAAAKVEEALALVDLAGLGRRRPDQLSGGQRQRVALARALVFQPDIVLMDEPLGALDRQLRERLQVEIKHIQRRLGVTVIYVTHDQVEALTLSDRIAVFAEGVVQQVGTPESIYERPANAFVAGFVGDNNGLKGVVATRNGTSCEIRLAGDLIVRATPVGAIAPGDEVVTMIRPEHVEVGSALASPCNLFQASVDDVAYHGDHNRVRAVLPGGSALTIRTEAGAAVPPSGGLTIGWCADHCLAFPAGSAPEVPA